MKNQNSNRVGNKRKEWIGLLGTADPAELESAKNNLDDFFGGHWNFIYIVKPETGMIMVQAKADGSKAQFNLGETTISRCILKVNDQYIGISWIMGSDLKHAELAALFDGLLQDPEHNEKINRLLIEKLQDEQKIKDEKLAREIAETKVEFFTLKRGE